MTYAVYGRERYEPWAKAMGGFKTKEEAEAWKAKEWGNLYHYSTIEPDDWQAPQVAEEGYIHKQDRIERERERLAQQAQQNISQGQTISEAERNALQRVTKDKLPSTEEINKQIRQSQQTRTTSSYIDPLPSRDTLTKRQQQMLSNLDKAYSSGEISRTSYNSLVKSIVKPDARAVGYTSQGGTYNIPASATYSGGSARQLTQPTGKEKAEDIVKQYRKQTIDVSKLPAGSEVRTYRGNIKDSKLEPDVSSLRSKASAVVKKEKELKRLEALQRQNGALDDRRITREDNSNSSDNLLNKNIFQRIQESFSSTTEQRKQELKEAGQYLRFQKQYGKDQPVARVLTGAGYLGLSVVSGVGGVVLHPVESVKGIFTTFLHPIKSGKALIQQAKEEPIWTVGETAGQWWALGKGMKIAGKGIKPLQQLNVKLNPKGVEYKLSGIHVEPGVTIPTELNVLKSFEGKKVPTTHATFSSELKAGSLIEPAPAKNVGPFRKSINQRNFYTSSPVEAGIEVLKGSRYEPLQKYVKTSYEKTLLAPKYQPVVYGGYIGIGDAYSAGAKVEYSLLPKTPKAIILRDTKISATPKEIASKDIKTVVEYQTKTGGTFVPAENLKGKSIEGQFTTASGVEGRPLMKLAESKGPLKNKFTYFNVKEPIPLILGGENAPKPIKSGWNALTSKNVKIKFMEAKLEQVGESFFKKGDIVENPGNINSQIRVQKSLVNESGSLLKPLSKTELKKSSVKSQKSLQKSMLESLPKSQKKSFSLISKKASPSLQRSMSKSFERSGKSLSPSPSRSLGSSFFSSGMSRVSGSSSSKSSSSSLLSSSFSSSSGSSGSSSSKPKKKNPPTSKITLLKSQSRSRGKPKKSSFGLASQPKQYTPSFGAIVAEIKGKRDPSGLVKSDLGIRPILKKFR